MIGASLYLFAGIAFQNMVRGVPLPSSPGARGATEAMALLPHGAFWGQVRALHSTSVLVSRMPAWLSLVPDLCMWCGICVRHQLGGLVSDGVTLAATCVQRQAAPWTVVSG
eukprot:COSAG05_NODE_2158_length_3458_cov_3.579637_3_plen_111_part_00